MTKKLLSNLKVIKSGVVPTISNLQKGQFAFGMVDGKARLFGNDGNSIREFTPQIEDDDDEAVLATNKVETKCLFEVFGYIFIDELLRSLGGEGLLLEYLPGVIREITGYLGLGYDFPLNFEESDLITDDGLPSQLFVNITNILAIVTYLILLTEAGNIGGGGNECQCRCLPPELKPRPREVLLTWWGAMSFFTLNKVKYMRYTDYSHSGRVILTPQFATLTLKVKPAMEEEWVQVRAGQSSFSAYSPFDIVLESHTENSADAFSTTDNLAFVSGWYTEDNVRYELKGTITNPANMFINLIDFFGMKAKAYSLYEYRHLH